MYVDITDAESCKKLGFELLGFIVEGGYEWDAFGVWRDYRSDQLIYGFDSGCSCFGPFEGGLEGLKRVGLGSLVDVEWDAIQSLSEHSNISREQLSRVLTTVREKVGR